MLETEGAVMSECLKLLQKHKTLFSKMVDDIGSLLIDAVLSQRFNTATLCKILQLLTTDMFTGKLQVIVPKENINLKVLCLILKVLLESANSDKWKKQAEALSNSYFMMRNKSFNVTGCTDAVDIVSQLTDAMSEVAPEIIMSILQYALDTPSLNKDENMCFSPLIWFLLKSATVSGAIESYDNFSQKALNCIREEIGFQLASAELQQLTCGNDIQLLSMVVTHNNSDNNSVIPLLFAVLKQYIVTLSKLEKSDIKTWEKIRLDIFVTMVQISSSMHLKSGSREWLNSTNFLTSHLFKTFFEMLFDGNASLVEFLTNILKDESLNVAHPIKLEVLHLLPVLLFTSPNQTSIVEILNSSPVYPVLLICCTSEDKQIRIATMNCFRVISSIQSCYSELAVFLSTNSDEIVTDSQHLPQCLKSYLMCDDLAQNKKAAEMRKKRNSLLQKILENHVIGTGKNIQIGDFELSILNKCFCEVNTEKMFDALNEAVCLLLQQKQDSSLSSNDHQFLTIVVKKAVTCKVSSEKLLSLFSKTLKPLGEDANFSTQCATLGLITKKQFLRLNETERIEMFTILLSLKAESQVAEVSSKVSKVLKIIPLHAEHINEQLLKCRKNMSGAKTSSVTAKKPKLNTDISDKTVNRVFLLSLLETLQHKKQIAQPQKLFAPLCALLSDYIVNEISDPSEYLAQLIIGCLLNLVKRVKSLDKIPTTDIQKSLQLEPVVHFIQQTENSLVHREAILLLAESVQFFPDKIVHTIMSIFTFMGSSLLRRDDSYSFQVMSQTIQSVVPALMSIKVSSGRHQQNAVEQILQVFVDALPHIPAHRRLTVLKELLNAVGPEKYAWQTMALLLGQRFTKSESKKSGQSQVGNLFQITDLN
uniref:HEAT repeat-containing protein 1 n=1 Tax=Phallusia mammillata TaxID=59560 RepID=A0A6F9DDQ0_9ASCI|nr:HEAT repeat-containing protein 1 [Phallusia mammillata]